jgi:radical SAM protein with 4Fe4S-binding SPASM domain
MDDAPYIQFYPTLRCNLTCGFCFNRDLPILDDVKPDDFRRMVSALGAAGIGCIDFLGGEPTLHPELAALLELVRDHRLTSNLSSNGRNVGALVALSTMFERDFLKIGISLQTDEVPADLHEYIMTHRPMLKSVVSRKVSLPRGGEPYVGLPGIEYFLLYRDAMDGSDLAECMPFDQYYRELTALMRARHGLDGVFCGGFLPGPESASPLSSVRCPAGTTKLSMLPDGSIYPCYLFFRYPEFRLGNGLVDRFEKIWRSPVLSHFRTFSHNLCPRTDCHLFSICHGGCPAASYMFYRDLAAPDPRCTGPAGRSRAPLILP